MPGPNIEKSDTQALSPRRRGLTLREVNLSQRAIGILTAPTPPEYIKERPARGGKKARYVEGGYVISLLNRAFGSLNWDFEVLGEEVTDGEVVVKGALTIKDHARGYSVTKNQYGGKTREKNVPLGDTKKAAATDAMKKCASLFGVALDVYWTDTEEVKARAVAKPALKSNSAELLKQMFDRIKASTDPLALAEWRVNTFHSEKLSGDVKDKLIQAINARLKELNPDS